MTHKKVYIIHGWGQDSNMAWIKWLEAELRKKGDEVHSFDMPNTENPKIEEWVRYLEDNIDSDSIAENVYFVGHSVGAQTIMRFLEKLHRHKKIGGGVFIAPWLDLINLEPEEMEIAHPWINSEIHFERVLDHCNNFLSIFSDNDPYVHLDESEKFRDKLGAKVIIKKKQEHFEDAEEIPEVLKFIK